MIKSHIALMIFAAFLMLLLILLTTKLFGDLAPKRMKILGGLLLAGMIGNAVCALLRASGDKEKYHV